MTHKHTYSIPSADDQNDARCIECGQLQPTTHTAKHTPGPLKAVQIIIENSPCTWAVQRKNIREQWGKPSIATYIDNEADARLFAAAPAMYEALTHALSVCEAEAELRGENDIDDYLGGAAGPVARMIRAALAQAEGRQG